MIVATIKHTSNRGYVTGIIKRAEAPLQAAKATADWILRERIPAMYSNRGFVRFGQARWAPLSAWTIAAKGHDMPMIQTGKMRSSYRIDVVRLGNGRLKLVMRNTAQSGGVAYPGILDSGTQRRPVRRPHKPGRALGPIALPGGGVGFFKSTHPKRIPARPHLRFLQVDARRAIQETARYVFPNGKINGRSTFVIPPAA